MVFTTPLAPTEHHAYRRAYHRRDQFRRKFMSLTEAPDAPAPKTYAPPLPREILLLEHVFGPGSFAALVALRGSK